MDASDLFSTCEAMWGHEGTGREDDSIPPPRGTYLPSYEFRKTSIHVSTSAPYISPDVEYMWRSTDDEATMASRGREGARDGAFESSPRGEGKR
jgi:hypothetical protein